MRIAVMNAYHGTLDTLNNTDMIFEPKLDGIRALCYVNRSVRFMTRYGNDCTDDYPELNSIRSSIKAKTCVLDGEIVAYNKKGLPSFEVLKEGAPAHYIVFDILMKDGKSLVHKPLLERKKILAATIQEGDNLHIIPFTFEGKALWRATQRAGLEGVMAKKAHDRYYPGARSHTWLKIKEHRTMDVVIVGYTIGKRVPSSLAMGLYDTKKKLHYIGRVGTGFNEQLLQELRTRLKLLEQSTSPVINEAVRGIIWVRPRLVAEVSYFEMTKYKRLRIPVFLRLRDDKKPQECTFAAQR